MDATASYTAIGEQVGMAQRMESAARPGAVMVSESTARLVEHVAVDVLAAAPTDPGCVVNDVAVLRLRALLAQTHGDTDSYQTHRDRYRTMATSLGFAGHMALAQAMP